MTQRVRSKSAPKKLQRQNEPCNPDQEDTQVLCDDDEEFGPYYPDIEEEWYAFQTERQLRWVQEEAEAWLDWAEWGGEFDAEGAHAEQSLPAATDPQHAARDEEAAEPAETRLQLAGHLVCADSKDDFGSNVCSG